MRRRRPGTRRPTSRWIESISCATTILRACVRDRGPAGRSSGGAHSRKIEQQHFGGRVSDYRHFLFVADRGAVAFRERDTINCDFAARHLHPSVAALLQIGPDSLSALELCDRQHGVLMNFHRLIAAIGRAYGREAATRLRIVDGPLLVARSDCARGGRDPDLQKMNRVSFRMIEFAVRDSRPGTHSLRFARANDRAGANAVLVFERAFENVGDDLHVAMPMGRETRAGTDAILVDYAQRAKSHLAGIVVVAAI